MNQVPAGSNGQMLLLSDLRQVLEDKFRNKAVGYAFVISYKDHFGTGSSDGFCRLSQDPTSRAMTVFEKYNIASVSKPISAAALMLLLAENDELSRDSPMWRWLPRHWEFGPHIKEITFRELMTHTSGFRSNGRSYATLKEIIKAGIRQSDKTYEYLNTNYALMRMIIPKLAGYPIFSLVDVPSYALAVNEPKQAKAFADAYIDFCRKRLFDKAGLFEMKCVNDSMEPGLFYSFGDQSLKGKNMGDQTMNAGSGGWVLSTAEMADIFRTIHYTEKIMPSWLSEMMREEKLGYGIDEKKETPVRSFFKGGSEDLDNREFGSAIMLFENGIQLAMMATSGLGLKRIGWDAFRKWYK